MFSVTNYQGYNTAGLHSIENALPSTGIRQADECRRETIGVVHSVDLMRVSPASGLVALPTSNSLAPGLTVTELVDGRMMVTVGYDALRTVTVPNA